jgi:hypothetical protein
MMMMWGVLVLATHALGETKYFAIEVVDDQTGRGVPLVELKTTNNIRYYTDSNGLVAFDEPGLMNQRVFFNVSSHGYEFAKDGFGIAGVGVDIKPGGSATLKIKRINIAERLYRSTGQGIYRDTAMLGRKAPIAEPVLNGQVMGQDSVIALPYRGKIYWFWGDTAKPSYPLGLFAMSGATSALPKDGGLKPSVGIDYHYFAGADGFSRPMAPLKEHGPVWIDGVMVVKDDKGADRMVCHFSRMKDLGTRLERGLMVYNDEKEMFERTKAVPLDAVLSPGAHPVRVKVGSEDFFYFPMPYPATRVKADWNSVMDLSRYEAYTPLAEGTRYAKGQSKLDRDQSGKLKWAWKKNTQPLQSTEIDDLVKEGKLKREECPFRLMDVDTRKPIKLHGSSVYWNEYRKKYVMIALQGFGTSVLGEVYFTESEKPEGPWVWAKKIVTHEKMDFYNPTQHPFFDEEGGKIIYFQGTYTNTFSGNPMATPWYEYNQVMYRLDLGDARLKMP